MYFCGVNFNFFFISDFIDLGSLAFFFFFLMSLAKGLSFKEHFLLFPFKCFFCVCFFFVCFFVFRATLEAYVSSQIRCPIGAAAAGLCHSQSNMGSEPYL